MNSYKLNDLVTVDPAVSRKYAGRELKIVAVPKGANGVNYKAKDEITGEIVRGRANCFIPAGSGTPIATVTAQEIFRRGELVKIKGRDNVFVVFNQGPKNVTVVELGGGGLEMYASPRGLTRLSTEDVLK